jgi:hypothetical protein
MDDREEIELTWRKEFDELGEAGVRHEFFKSAYLSNQRKEGFAYRWLGEKRKAQEKMNRRRERNIWVVLNIFVGLVIAGVIVINWFPGLIPFPLLEK